MRDVIVSLFEPGQPSRSAGPTGWTWRPHRRPARPGVRCSGAMWRPTSGPTSMRSWSCCATTSGSPCHRRCGGLTGATAVAAYRQGFGAEDPHAWRRVPTRANRQPAAASYRFTKT